MDFNTIREFLIADEGLASFVDDNIFLFDRPEKCACEDYITYSPKEMQSIGGGVRAYQLDVRVISKDKLKLLAIKNRLIELLDCHNRATRIKDDDAYIRKIRLINGGGIAKAENGDYYAFLYFYVIV